MKEVLFRAWQDGQMLTQPISGIFGLQRFIGFLNETAVIEQYTGLKDKNDKKIFEGDRLKIDDIDGIVIFENGAVRLDMDNDVYSHTILNQERTRRFKIIGNIHKGTK